MEEKTTFPALGKAARALNAAGVEWALGASAMMYFRGLTDTFHDYDLLIADGHMDTAKAALLAAGAVVAPPKAPSDVYVSKQFAECTLDGAEFDLLCGFSIRVENAVYTYPFTGARTQGIQRVAEETVPLAPLADWYVLYLLMPGREARAAEIAAYLRAQPPETYGGFLTLWLEGALPPAVRVQVEALLPG